MTSHFLWSGMATCGERSRRGPHESGRDWHHFYPDQFSIIVQNKNQNEETNINPNYNLQYLIDLFNYLHVHHHHWAMAVDTRNLGLSGNEYKTEENRNRQT